MGTPNVSYLKEHGPARADELPREVDVDDRQAGLHVFTITRGKGPAMPIGGQPPNKVCYLESHDKSNVLRCFLDANPQIVEARNARSMIPVLRRHGQAWHDHVERVIPEYFDVEAEYSDGPAEPGRSYSETNECPFCGEDVPASKFPRHLHYLCRKQ